MSHCCLGYTCLYLFHTTGSITCCFTRPHIRVSGSLIYFKILCLPRVGNVLLRWYLWFIEGHDLVLFWYQVFIQWQNKMSGGKWRLCHSDRCFYYSTWRVPSVVVWVTPYLTFSYRKKVSTSLKTETHT